MIEQVIQLRNRKYKLLEPFWLWLGRSVRFVMLRLPLPSTVKMIGQYGPFSMPSEFIFSKLESWGKGRNNGFEVYVRAARGKQCILDIGAHVGFTVLPVAKQIGGEGVVHAFEPSRINAKKLKEAVRLNEFRNVVIHEVLVGEKSQKERAFYEKSDICGTNSISDFNSEQGYQTKLVPQVSLDDFCTQRAVAPDLIKIDVEGAEIEVLKGGERFFSSSTPEIFLSVHPREIKALGYDLGDLLKILW